VFATAPASGSGVFPATLNLYGIVILFLTFWHFTRFKFMKLRTALREEIITISDAKKHFFSAINMQIIVAIFLFAIEIYVLDLKKILVQSLGMREPATLLNATGLAIFMLHLVIVWHWAYRAMGDRISIGKSAGDYVRSNIKFNLVIFLPWLIFLVLRDLLNTLSPSLLAQLEGSFLFQVAFFGAFLLVLSILAPVFITRMWDCEPLEDSDLKYGITNYCRSQVVEFKEIMSWNALNSSLVTAGVIGLIKPFRYLMITPELRNLLNKDELMGVVSHEVGHVKKKHLFFYLLFFLGFVILGIRMIEWVIVMGINILPVSAITNGTLNFISIFFSLLLFVVYFRFIFGYFMRIFERQADLYCFDSGVDPNHLVTSFMKLGVHTGDDGKKSNWHHYNISQRIDFIRRCMDNPSEITRHTKKVKYSLRFFLSALLAISFISFQAPVGLEYRVMETMLQNRIEKDPNNPELYSLLGAVSYQLEKWNETKDAYEKSLLLDYDQSEVLNNLAWLYLKCEDQELLNPTRALRLARDAARIRQTAHILDTLAEAYFQNSMYKEAYVNSRKAFLLASENIDYYRSQLEKMQKYYQKFKKTIRI
jgi:Zn-dependent protease with chaperone function